MNVLRLTVEHMFGETATSAVSRLTARNGLPLAQGFCLDHRLKLQNVADGDLATIHSLAEMAGMDANRLLACSFRRMPSNTFRLGAEIIMPRWMSRSVLRVCPACLVDDAAASTFEPDAAMYGRVWWQVAFVRTCHVHDRALVVLGRGSGGIIHDFAASLRPHALDLPRLAADAEPRVATELEGYVIRRLTGVAGGVPVLDGLQVGLAARFCEVLGTVRLYGRARRSGKLDDEQLRMVGQEGFQMAAAGDGEVRSYIAGLLDPAAEGRRANGGVQSALGRLHDWLADNRRSAGQDGLREFVRGICAENMPLGAEDACLGGAVGARKVHSIRSASLETGVHPKRLRKVLHEAGLIGADHVGRPDNLVTFPADTSAELLSKLDGTMALAKVSKYINAPRVQAKLLHDAGFLVPVYPRQRAGKRILAFAQTDMDAFMASLSDQAEVFAGEKDGAFSIPVAAKRVPCGAIDIVRLIRGRRLPWVGRSSDHRGYLSIRVRPDQVRPVLFPDIGISVREAATRLGLHIDMTRRLLGHGFLKAMDGGGLKYKHETYIVDPGSIVRFRQTYVALSDLVPRWGPTRLEARSALIKAGIKPSISSYEVGKAYFLKADLDGINPTRIRNNYCRKQTL